MFSGATLVVPTDTYPTVNAAITAAADGDRIEQVVRNLVDNAVRVTPRGGAVTVTLWQRPDAAGFTVSDDGPGVPAAARERIFDRFATEEPARGHTAGAGLGLAISREIVAAHHGSIWVEDRSPAGSVFWVALPIAARTDP